MRCFKVVGWLLVLMMGLGAGGAWGGTPCGEYEGTARFLSQVYLNTDQWVHGLIGEGSLLFTQSGIGMTVMDIGDPTQPAVLAFLPECRGTGFAKEDSLMVTATADDAIVSWDFGLPLHPAPRDTLGNGFFAPMDITNLEMAGTRAFVATRTQGVVILELSGPEGLVALGSWDHSETVNDIAVYGNTGYAVSTRGLSVLDLSNAAHPVQVAGLDAPALWAIVEDGQLLVGNNEATEVHALDDPWQPVRIYRREHPYREAVALGSGLVAGVDYPNLTVLDPIESLGAEDAALALGTSWEGLGVVQVHGSLVIRASRDFVSFYEHQQARQVRGSPRHEVPGGDIADLTHNGDLVTWLIGEPGNVRLEIRRLQEDGALHPVGELGEQGPWWEVALDGDLAVLRGNQTLGLVDVANPADPVLVSSIEIPDWFSEVALDGDDLVAIASEELLLYDVSDPAAPVLRDQHPFHLAGNLVLEDGIACVSGPFGWTGIYLYSVGEGSIEPLGTVPVDNIFEDLSLRDGLLLAQHGNYQHEVYDVSDPSHPFLLNSTRTWAQGPSLLLDGRALVGDGANVRFYDLTPDHSLELVGCFWFPWLEGIEPLDDGRVLLWNSRQTQVAPSPCSWVSPYPPAGHALEPAAHLEAGPNPFNPQTTIRFEMPAGGYCRLAIHDVQGRRIRTLCAENLTAGPQEMVWKGRDDAGRALPSGMYFARLENAAGVASCKLVLLK